MAIYARMCLFCFVLFQKWNEIRSWRSVLPLKSWRSSGIVRLMKGIRCAVCDANSVIIKEHSQEHPCTYPCVRCGTHTKALKDHFEHRSYLYLEAGGQATQIKNPL